MTTPTSSKSKNVDCKLGLNRRGFLQTSAVATGGLMLV